ncbi:MAG: ABC transporter, partial [Limnospira sp.]
TPESETADEGETSETEETPEEAKLVVLGNSQFATNGWFDQQLNRDVFINSITWLSTDQETLSIGVKPATSRRILMTPPLSRFLQLMAIFIFPLVAFAIAGFLWWRRR